VQIEILGARGDGKAIVIHPQPAVKGAILSILPDAFLCEVPSIQLTLLAQSQPPGHLLPRESFKENRRCIEV